MTCTCQNTLFTTFLERPEPDSRVVARGSKSAIVGTKAQASDGLPVARPRSEVVHIRLEVLDDTTLVRRCKVCPRVREFHGPYCAVMCLQDSLEVESQAVPEGEFTARRAREHTTALRGPLQ